MKIKQIEVLHADAGWRPWSFIKITTDAGMVGWSECSESHGSPRGIEGVVKDIAPLLFGQDPRLVEKHVQLLYARTRQSAGGIVAKAIGGVENALLDIKAKSLGISVAELFGGSVREKIPLYWSHCGTSRVRAWKEVKRPQIKNFSDLARFGKEVQKSGFSAVKTNLALLGGTPHIYMPGFAKSEGGPELNVNARLLGEIDRYVGRFRSAVGTDIAMMVDLNFNFRTGGYIQVGRLLEPYGLSWLELDAYDPKALRLIRDRIAIPVCSGENLFGLRQYKPFFEERAMDMVSIDVMWNGFMQSKKISDTADAYEMNVTPHNFNGHLATFISAQFAALTPNLCNLEIDVDDVPWRDELFTNVPDIKDGMLTLPRGLGWGIEVNEKALRHHPWSKP